MCGRGPGFRGLAVSLNLASFHGAMQADEELLLLESVDMYGLGNWPAVAEHIGTKTDAEAKAHYFQVYIESPNFPLPTPVPEMAHVRLPNQLPTHPQLPVW